MMRNPKFFELLATNKITSPEVAKKLEQKFQGDAMASMEYLLEKKVADKATLGQLWGDTFKVAFIELDKTVFQAEVVQLLGEKFARNHHIIPVYQIGDVVTVAMANPADQAALRKAERMIGRATSRTCAFLEDIEKAIDQHYRAVTEIDPNAPKSAIRKLLEAGKQLSEAQLQSLGGESAVADFANEIISLASSKQASDIHIEPCENFVRIRYRIDGVLQDVIKLENELLPTLMSCLKLLAELDIAERRRPQEGRINFSMSGNSVDIRFSSVPTIYGEKVVLRILGQDQMREIPDLSTLGFSLKGYDRLKNIIGMPNGIFLVSGPTGSGKTTTLFSILNALNKPDVNITTIEDPVEYRLEGINQVQVNKAINLDFGAALRYFLRQDPDIILVGEIRDLETAKISIQAAMTGHFVLATIHTNSALQVLTRLVNIGVEPFMVAASVRGIMAQRLVRKICSQCKQEYALSPEEVESLFITNGNKTVNYYRGNGCSECNHTGYSGRMAIHETLLVDEELRRLVAKDASLAEMAASAESTGFQNLHYDGIKKVLRGLTTIDEINRVSLQDG